MPKRRTGKGKPGRPRRTDDPQRMTLKIAGDLKRQLQHRAIDEGRNANDIVEDALRVYLRRRS
jgi:hypothetical protein